MASAKPARKCPPDGTYPFNITAAAATQTKVKNEGQPNQKGGDTAVELSLEVAEGEYAGYPAFDTLGTDGGTDFGAMSKKKWRQLGVNVDTDAEIPDDVIASGLLNQRVFAVVEREPQQKMNDATKKWEIVYDLDEQTGAKVPRYRLKIIGYRQQPTAGQQMMPQGQQLQQPNAPQYPAAPGLPQGFPQGQQLNAPQAPQFQQQPQGMPPGFPTQLPQAGGFPGAPGGFQPPPGAPGAAQFAPPGGFPPAGPGGFPQVQAPQGWVQPGAPNGVPGQQPQAGLAPGQQPLPGMPGQPR